MMFLRQRSWTLNELNSPWESDESIYTFLKGNPDARNLPDKKLVEKPNQISFAPGALDGVSTHHAYAPGGIDDRLKRLCSAFDKLLSTATDATLRAVYDAAIEESVISIADKFLEGLPKETINVHFNRIGEIGRYFAGGAPQREAVKFGILLLEVTAIQSDIPMLETLARHDEFTLYAAIALANLSDSPERTIWRIAQQVRGWGRIQVVERLSKTKDPDIRAWMIRDGFRNDIVDSYLAGICADAGDLAGALEAASVDHELLDGAAGILRALTEPHGPSGTIDNYKDAPRAVRGYLKHAANAPELKLEHFFCLSLLRDFLSEGPEWQQRLTQGWTESERVDDLAGCKKVLDRDIWRSQIEAGLLSEVYGTFFEADSAAKILEIDTRSIHLERVKREPLSGSWYRLLEQTDESGIDEVLELATQKIPLAEIATGPDTILGLGPGFEAHRTLGWVLQDLKRFPMRGWNLIRIGIQSPVIINRNMALNAFERWPRERWPADALAVLTRAAKLEPNEKVKLRLEAAIRMN